MPKRLLILLLLLLLFVTVPAFLLLQFEIALPTWLSANLTGLFYGLVLLGLVLCWFFYNSREFTLLLLLGATVWVLKNFFWQGSLPASRLDILFHLITFLLPLNVLWINFLSERGLGNQYGLRRVALVMIQALLICGLVLYPVAELENVLQYSPLTWLLLEKTPLGQLPLLGAVAAVFLITGYCLLRPGQLQTARLIMLVTVITGLHYSGQMELSLIYFLLAALVLITGTVINAYHLAYRDELTQLPSRRSLRQQLLGLGKTYAVAMVDVDHFKKLNDTHGHDVGDDVLRLLATHLQGVAGGGRAFRYGGEEFTLVFPGKTASEAGIYLDAMREKIATNPFTVRHKKRPRKKPKKRAKNTGTKRLKVTVSIGVAESEASQKSAQDVIKAADKALYKAKKAGRNRLAVGNN